MAKIRITKCFGEWAVSAMDNNGEWVSIEPGQDVFATREEAQEYVDRWMSLNDDMEQVEVD